MIPDLSKLPQIPQEPSPLRRLIRPVLVFVVILALGAGVVWYMKVGVEDYARDEMGVTQGLNSVAEDLWLKGNAPEVRVPDPELAKQVLRLRARLSGAPRIVVSTAENRPGFATASHEIIYLKDNIQILTIRIFLDKDEGRIDLLGFRINPEYAEQEPGL